MSILVEALAGALLAFLALWVVLRPLVRPGSAPAPVYEPVDPEETPKGIALAALKEIEFDRETGKLSDADYELLKAKYTAAALEALREAESAVEPGTPSPGAGDTLPPGVSCPSCGPRPEPDPAFCSTCGRPLARLVAA